MEISLTFLKYLYISQRNIVSKSFEYMDVSHVVKCISATYVTNAMNGISNIYKFIIKLTYEHHTELWQFSNFCLSYKILLAWRNFDICKFTPLLSFWLNISFACHIFIRLIHVFQGCRGKGISTPTPIPFPQDFCWNPHGDPHRRKSYSHSHGYGDPYGDSHTHGNPEKHELNV